MRSDTALLQGSSSQSRKINCKWEIGPSMCWECRRQRCQRGTTLVTTMLSLVRAKKTPRPRRQTVSSHSIMWVPLTLSLTVSGKSPTMPRPLCDLLACLLLLLLRSLALSLTALNPRAFGLRAPAECRAASKREKPDAYSLSLGPRASFAPHRIFLALRIAVISAVWPLLLLAMSCMPPSPRDECESGHCACCKPLRFLSRAA